MSKLFSLIFTLNYYVWHETWKLNNFICTMQIVSIFFRKNVVRENDERQLSSGGCRTEKKCGYWILKGNKLPWCRLHSVPTFDAESCGLSTWKPQFLSVVQSPFDNCHSSFSPTTFFEKSVYIDLPHFFPSPKKSALVLHEQV